MIAKNIIENDESAVIISTDDTGWKTFDGGFAMTGDWVIKKDFAVDKAIIYKRDQETNLTEVYLGRPLDVFPSKKAKRFVIRLSDGSFVGTTETEWCKFSGSKKGATNPVKYINRKNSKPADNFLLNLF